MPINSSSTDDTARFAHLAAVLDRLRSLMRLYDAAAEIFVNFPKLRREEIEADDALLDGNITHGLARSAPAAREAERKELLQDISALESVLHEHSVPAMRFDAKDLDLIINFVVALDMLQARSKRELGRLFDAIRANDIGTLTTTAVPSKGNTRQKLEMAFRNDPLPIVAAKTKSTT